MLFAHLYDIFCPADIYVHDFLAVVRIYRYDACYVEHDHFRAFRRLKKSFQIFFIAKVAVRYFNLSRQILCRFVTLKDKCPYSLIFLYKLSAHRASKKSCCSCYQIHPVCFTHLSFPLFPTYFVFVWILKSL